jgi:hypothetical protein
MSRLTVVVLMEPVNGSMTELLSLTLPVAQEDGQSQELDPVEDLIELEIAQLLEIILQIQMEQDALQQIFVNLVGKSVTM